MKEPLMHPVHLELVAEHAQPRQPRREQGFLHGHFHVPPTLRAALSGCLCSLAATGLLIWFSATALAQAEEEHKRALNDIRNTSAQLARAREDEAARESRTRRFDALKGILAGKVDAAHISRQLSAHPYIDNAILDVQDSRPAFPSTSGLPPVMRQRIQIEADLLHEDALLALNDIVTNTTARFISTECSLRRQAAPFALRVRCAFELVALPENS